MRNVMHRRLWFGSNLARIHETHRAARRWDVIV
jgi:hypothetical protein